MLEVFVKFYKYLVWNYECLRNVFGKLRVCLGKQKNQFFFKWLFLSMRNMSL